MKRYLVFAGSVLRNKERVYPVGGWENFVRDFDDKKQAIDFAKSVGQFDGLTKLEWSHVVDLETCEIVWPKDECRCKK